MTINESKFIYANEDSDSHEVMLCSIDTPNTDTNDETNNIIMSTTPFKDTWDFHGLEKSEPLKFTITIAKNNPNGEYFNAYDMRSIKKWLCNGKYNWLQIDQTDIADAYYYCILTDPRPVNVGSLNAGIQLSVTCNAPYAWSELKSKTYQSTTTYQFPIKNEVDVNDYIVCPILTITPKANGNITIKNDTTNRSITFTNCIANEVITLDGRNYKIKSSNGRVMLDAWNKNNLELIEGSNSITLTGNFTLQMQYRLPIRIGG